MESLISIDRWKKVSDKWNVWKDYFEKKLKTNGIENIQV